MPYLHWNVLKNQKDFREAFKHLAEQYKQKNNQLLGHYSTNRCKSVYPFDAELPYHPTRTLDQYFCQNLDTDCRDKSQTTVQDEEKLLVIDQLWIIVPSKGRQRFQLLSQCVTN